MLALRNSRMMLKICNYSFWRRCGCWRLLAAVRSEFRGSNTPVLRRLFSHSSMSLQSSENAEETTSDDLAEMRSRMRKLHNIVSANGATLADYKRLSSEDKELDVSNSAFLEDASEDDCFEDTFSESKPLLDSNVKGLRKQKDVDVVLNMPYGHVRFDSMNRPKSTRRSVAEGSDDTQNEIPSVKILKEDQHIFSVNAMEEYEVSLEHGSEDVAVHETCGVSSQTESEANATKPNLFDEQCFDDVLQQEEEKQRNISNSNTLEGTITDSTTCGMTQNLFDEQYFSDVLQREDQKPTNFSSSEMAKHGVRKSETSDMMPNVFDEEYFGDILQQEEKYQNTLNNSRSDHVEDTHKRDRLSIVENSESNLKTTSINDEQLSLFDEQYFGSYAHDQFPSSQPVQKDDSGKGVFSISDRMSHSQQKHRLLESDSSDKFQQHSMHVTTLNERNATPTPMWKEVEDMVKDTVTDDDNSVVVEPITRREMKARTRPKADVDNPKTAYDLSMKIRLEQRQKRDTSKNQQAFVVPKDSKWTGRVDSHGFRILQDQVINVQQLTEEQILLILKDSIIHEDDKLVVIDKPYGLPSHGGPGVHHSVGKLLAPLALRIDQTGQLQTLYLVHRLDKESTGVMLLAKSLQVAEFLLAMFKKRQVVKHYWVITKSVPQPQQGIIDIPMAEDIVGNRYRMALRPIVKADGRSVRPSSFMGSSFEATTNYRVLSENGSAALVECTPETGVKHQIRCHLAFGLNTPILGDHKYSHYSKIAPQKLHPEMLQKLGIRQAKVRHVPMHLHAKAVVLPEWINGRNLFLSARLPAHFVQNMKWLKLKPPS